MTKLVHPEDVIGKKKKDPGHLLTASFQPTYFPGVRWVKDFLHHL